MKYFILVLIMCLSFPCYAMKVSRTGLTIQGNQIIRLNQTSELTQKQITELNKQLDQIILCLNGRITFVDGEISNQEKSENLDGQFIVFTSLGADVETTIPHTLGRIPVGYIIVSQDRASSLYHASTDTSWTTSNIYLKSSAATATYTILIF